MITVGYGDIKPITGLEKIFCILIMLIANGVFGYTFNQISNIFADLDKTSEDIK